MHLADAFIQSYNFFYQYLCSLGIEPTTFCAANAMLYDQLADEQMCIRSNYIWVFVLFYLF